MHTNIYLISNVVEDFAFILKLKELYKMELIPQSVLQLLWQRFSLKVGRILFSKLPVLF